MQPCNVGTHDAGCLSAALKVIWILYLNEVVGFMSNGWRKEWSKSVQNRQRSWTSSVHRMTVLGIVLSVYTLHHSPFTLKPSGDCSFGTPYNYVSHTLTNAHTFGSSNDWLGCVVVSPGDLTLSVPCCHQCLEDDNTMDGGGGVREINKADMWERKDGGLIRKEMDRRIIKEENRRKRHCERIKL